MNKLIYKLLTFVAIFGLLLIILASWNTNYLFNLYKSNVYKSSDYLPESENVDNPNKITIDTIQNKTRQSSILLYIILAFLGLIIIFFLIYLDKSSKEMYLQYKNLELIQTKIQNIINVTNVATWEWNYETKEILINENFAGMCGYTLPELTPMTYDVWEAMIHPDDLERVRSTTQNHINGVLPVLEYECRVLNKSGSFMWFHVRGKIISWDQNEQPIWIYGVDSDITETKNAQDINNQYQKLETVGVLAGGIAHEFNNIMTGAYGYIELALPKVNEEKAKKYLQSSIASLDKAKLISNKLLTFSEGGKIITASQQIEYFLRHTIVSIVKNHSYSISFHNLTDLWLVFYDKNQIYNVMMNILYNSMESMPNGGHIIVATANTTIRSHNILEPGNYIKISITDHGCGIPEENISRIFDPFFTTKERHQGLGLTLSFSVVKKHNGCIDVQSSDQGSKFCIFLPADFPMDAVIGNEDEESTERASQKIMLLDDDEPSRDILIQILSVLGYDMLISYSFEQTIQLLDQNSNNNVVAIMVNLATLQKGLRHDIAKTLRTHTADIPVYITSSMHDDPMMKHPKKYHFTDCIKKPFTIFDIEEKLSKLSKDEE